MKNLIFLISLVVVWLSSTFAFAQSAPPEPFADNCHSYGDNKAKEYARQWMQNKPPIQFLENKGQMVDMDGKPVPFVLLKASAPGMDMYVTEKGLTYIFHKEEEKEIEPVPIPLLKRAGHDEDFEDTSSEWTRVDMDLKGARIKRENVITTGISDWVNHYYLGHCSNGIRNVHAYEKITIKNVYPGIDWALYNSDTKGFKYDFIVQAGADPKQVELIYSSLNPLTLNSKGEIEIKTEIGELLERHPISFQDGKDISTQFIKTLNQKNNNGGYDTHIKFTLENYNSTKQLIIDPQLVWSTLYVGGDLDGFCSVDTDTQGNVFVTGYTVSSNFPVKTNSTYYQGLMNPGGDLIILKFNNSGVLIWSTFYGGDAVDWGFSIELDLSNNIFITGETRSSNFPTINAGTYYDGILGGMDDGFILKFDNNGNRLWASYFGGNSGANSFYPTEFGSSIKSDISGNIFITGATPSFDFPTKPFGGAYYDGTIGDDFDAFISKFDNNGNLLWSTFIGGTNTGFNGSSEDMGCALTIANSGDVYITGTTNCSTVQGFPIKSLVGAYNDNSNAGGGGDIFIMRFTNNGVLQWSTFYGGNSNDIGYSIVSDNSNNIFITGLTASPDFPTQNAGTYYDGSIAGGWGDEFILKFNSNGVRQWATYFGGSISEGGSNPFLISFDGAEVDACGNLYVGFETRSSDIATLNPACGSFYDGSYADGGSFGDAYIAKFTNNGTLIWGTYFGGVSDENRVALAIDNNNNLFVAGESTTPGAFGPQTPLIPLINPGAGAYYQGSHGGKDDSYIAKFIPTPITLATSQVNSASCTCNGSATANPFCGVAPYSYSWSNLQTTQTSVGLCPGIYTVTVSDASCGKVTTASYTITGGGGNIALSAAQTNVICSSLGSAIVTANGGALPYSYLWSNSQTTATTTGLTAGSYTVTVTDANGCYSVQAVTITQSTPLSASLSATQTGCSSSTGTVTVFASGGNLPYTYLWNNSQTTATATGLATGNYTVTITDINGCSLTKTANVIQPIPMTSTLSTQWSCSSNFGSATVSSINGGNPSYSYLWSNGQIAQTATALNTGTYTVTISDSNAGCILINTIAVAPPAITVAMSAYNDPCGISNNAIPSVLGNGTAPYTYLWNTGQTVAVLTGLAAGSYTLTVTDATGCTKTATATFTNPPIAPNATFTQAPGGTICAGSPVTFSNTGTTGSGVTYNWLISPIAPANVSGTTTNFSYVFLSTGSYTIQHTVNSGSCSSTITSTVTVVNCSAGPTVTAYGSSVCQGSCAILTSNGAGGTSPYNYSWSNGATTQIINTCPASTSSYTVKITDSGGATATTIVIVTVNPAVNVTILPTSITCNGGTASASASGGSGSLPYVYNWNNGQTTPIATGLTAGNYTVTVTDAKSCTVTSSVTITSPPPLIGQFSKGTANCASCGCKEWIMVNVTGGTRPYSYAWPDGYINRFKNKLCPGPYSINVTDKNGCSVNVNISTP